MTKGRSILTIASLLGLAIVAVAVVSVRTSAAVTAEKPVVVIETSMGNITVELEPDLAPKTVANFLKYVDKDFYSGTVFHRVIKSFMIQGGGMGPDLKEKTP